MELLGTLCTGTARAWCLTNNLVLKSESQKRGMGTNTDLEYISLCVAAGILSIDQPHKFEGAE